MPFLPMPKTLTQIRRLFNDPREGPIVAPKSTHKTELVIEVLQALEVARLKLGLSARDFCVKAAMSYQTWMYWNNGTTAPNLGTLEKLLKAHNLHLLIVTEGDTDVYSDDTKFIANLIQLMPTAMRKEVREFVSGKLATELEHSRIKAKASAPPPEEGK